MRIVKLQCITNDGNNGDVAGDGSDSDNCNDKHAYVTHKMLQNSKLFSDIIDTYDRDHSRNGGGSRDENGVEEGSVSGHFCVVYPSQHHSVFDSYVTYLETGHVDLKTVKECLLLCHYIVDDVYFDKLVSKLLVIMINNTTCIDDFNHYLKMEIYLRSPLFLIPEVFTSDSNFVNSWAKSNSDMTYWIDKERYRVNVHLHDTTTNIVIDGDTGKSHVDNSNCHHKIKTITSTMYSKVDKKEYQRHGPCITLDDQGYVVELAHYDKDCRHGVSTTYHDNSKQPKFRAVHNHDKIDGCHTKWSKSGLLIFEHNYINNIKNGMSRGWFVDESNNVCYPFYSHHYRNGVKDGKCSGWHTMSNKIKYNLTYRNGHKLSGSGYDPSGKTTPYYKVNHCNFEFTS